MRGYARCGSATDELGGSVLYSDFEFREDAIEYVGIGDSGDECCDYPSQRLYTAERLLTGYAVMRIIDCQDERHWRPVGCLVSPRRVDGDASTSRIKNGTVKSEVR